MLDRQTRKRWRPVQGCHEVLEVLPYSGLEIAIEQAEDWIADTEE